MRNEELGKIVQGESRSQIYLDYAEPPPILRKHEVFAN